MKKNCPSCGASCEVNRTTSIGECEYCSSAFYLKDDVMLEYGKMNILAEPESSLYVGASGEIAGKRFSVIGRVRYRFEEGFWDEWYLQDETFQPFWLSESEGEFSISKEVSLKGQIPSFDEIFPGMQLSIDCEEDGVLEVFADEKDHAYLDGISGQLPDMLAADKSFPYVDASQNDISITIEYTDDGIEVYRGDWVDFDDIILNN